MNPTWIGLGLTLVVLGFNLAMFTVLKFNDLHHLSQDFSELKKEFREGIDEIKDCVVEQGNRLTAMEVKCRERHTRKRNTIK